MKMLRLAVLSVLVLVAASCSMTTEPKPSFVSRYRVLDAEVRGDGVILRWSSFYSGDDPEGGHHDVEQPFRVCIQRSTGSNYENVAWHDGGIEHDSLLVALPPAGEMTRYRAVFFAKSAALMLISQASEISASVVTSTRVLSLPPAFRWSGLDWSPDGTRLLSTRMTAFTELDNVIIDAATGSATDLPRPPGGSEGLGDCHWSPSGDWIAFWSTPTVTSAGLDYRIWIARANGDSMRAVTESDCWIPAWGAEDSTLAFLEDSRILLTNPFRAGPPRPLPRLRTRGIRDLSIRRTDGRIAYANYDAESGLAEMHLFDIRPGDNEPTRLTGDEGTNDDSPAWSPDGSRIAFISNRSGHRDVWLLDRATGRLRQLTSTRQFTREAASLAWSPDGSEVAVVQNLGFQEWQVAFYRP